MRYAVLGAGGLGGLVGGALARAGHSVTLVVRDPAHPATLLVESAVLGNFEVAVAVTTVLKEPVDVLGLPNRLPPPNELRPNRELPKLPEERAAV